MPEINLELCMGCGVCEYVCPNDVIRMRGQTAYVEYPEDCVSIRNCWTCLKACPVGAIGWKDHTDKIRVEFTSRFAWEERKRAWGISMESKSTADAARRSVPENAGPISYDGAPESNQR